MELKNFFALDLQGNALRNPVAYLYQVGTQTLVTGLQSADGTARTNPFTGSTSGQLSFAAPDGEYDLRVVGGGRDTTMRVQFLDAGEQVADVAASVASATASALAAQNSATVASTSATTATTQAGIATTKAGEAASHATTATTQAGIAATKSDEAATSAATSTAGANTATTKASEALTSSTSAAGSAATAATHATNAATQAGVATTKAAEAVTSADAAAASATTATTRATEAAASATAAGISETNSAASAAAAEAEADDIRENWSDKLALAGSAAATATAQADIATAQATTASTAKTAAEAARDAAFVNANVYDTTTAGLAATTNGQQFQVVVGGEIIRYRNDAGAAVEVARYPSAGFQRYMGVATASTVPEVATNNYYVARTPGTYTNFGNLIVGNEIAHLRYTGSAWVKDVIVDFTKPQTVLGEVVSGFIYPASNGNTNQVVVRVQPNTRIIGKYNDSKEIIVNVTAGDNFVIDRTTTHPDINNNNVGKLYCSLAGQLAVVYGLDQIPPGEWLLVATCYDYGTTNNGYFPYQPVIASNHYGYSREDNMLIDVHPTQRSINIKNIGGLVDGVTEDTQAYKLAKWITHAFKNSSNAYNVFQSSRGPYDVYIPAGTSLLGGAGNDFQSIRFVGDGMDLSKIKAVGGLREMNVMAASHITLHNFMIGGFDAPEKTDFNRLRVKTDAGLTNGSTYLVATGTKDYDIQYCDFDYAGELYMGLHINGYRDLKLIGNTFNRSRQANVWHHVRISSPITDDHSIAVEHNKTHDGVTGIFFGSDRQRPVKGGVVRHNECVAVLEEGIAFDGFGNNPELCPVICNGVITSASNDAQGRLVVVADMKYHDGTTANVNCPVSLRTDWASFYFTLGEGTGREGTYCKIIAANSTTNAFTIDVRTPASKIEIGGKCGVQSGFFDFEVTYNKVSGSVGNGPAYNYATAFSIYLNVFGFDVSKNKAVGCANGINVAGGKMLSTYDCLAYHNIVENNTFIDCAELPLTDGAVARFESYYGDVKQYGNKFMDNTVIGGLKGVMAVHQQDFYYDGNQMRGVGENQLKHCGNTLPQADSTQVGRTFMKITDDANGDPTAIEYYVCKLAGGTYSWVAI
jgi:hypothetical protein